MKNDVGDNLMFETEESKLYLDEILVEYEGPQLLTCKDKFDNIYLSVFSGRYVDLERWVLVRISEDRLQEIYKDKLTLYDAFKESEDSIALVLEQNIHTLKETERTILASSLNDEWLPTSGYYLELEN